MEIGRTDLTGEASKDRWPALGYCCAMSIGPPPEIPRKRLDESIARAAIYSARFDGLG
jgi:hypothetical protein